MMRCIGSTFPIPHSLTLALSVFTHAHLVTFWIFSIYLFKFIWSYSSFVLYFSNSGSGLGEGSDVRKQKSDFWVVFFCRSRFVMLLLYRVIVVFASSYRLLFALYCFGCSMIMFLMAPCVYNLFDWPHLARLWNIQGCFIYSTKLWMGRISAIEKAVVVTLIWRD